MAKFLKWYFWIIPAVAILIAGRQLYLSKLYGLSTWKGGGMGMFASADLAHRYVRVFVEIAGRPRILITELTPEQNLLMRQAEIYPTTDNLAKLGASIRKTQFRASPEPGHIIQFRKSGEQIGRSNAVYILAQAVKSDVADTDPDWTVVIEFWQLSYEPASRLVFTSLVRRAEFGPSSPSSPIPKL